MCPYTQLIPHRPTSHQQRSGEACEVGDEFLEVDGAFAVTEDIVAQTVFLNGSKHGQGRAGGDIAFSLLVPYLEGLCEEDR